MLTWEFEDEIKTNTKIPRNSQASFSTYTLTTGNRTIYTTIGSCPGCSHDTDPVFNSVGAKATIEFHMKQVHGWRS